MPARCGCGAAPALPKTIKREALEELTLKTKLKPAEVKALYRRFRLLAPSGYMLPDQFRETMGVLGLTDDPFLPDRMFIVFDADQDGKLSFFEFASSLAVMIRGTEDEKLQLSFEMAAGRRGAPGISFSDFQQLIRACNNMMQSIVTPDVRPVHDDHIRLMFRDLASDGSGDDREEPVITMEDYKFAAQNNDNFLVSLGLIAAPSARPRTKSTGRDNRKMTLTNASSAGNALAFPYTPGAGSANGTGAQEHYVITSAQIAELREKVATLKEVVLQDKVGAASSLASGTSSPSGALPAPSTTGLDPRAGHSQPAADDPDERWWTPLPKKNLRWDQHVSVAVGPKTVDDLAGEFDKVLGWCRSATEARYDGASRLSWPLRDNSTDEFWNRALMMSPQASPSHRPSSNPATPKEVSRDISRDISRDVSRDPECAERNARQFSSSGSDDETAPGGLGLQTEASNSRKVTQLSNDSSGRNLSQRPRTNTNTTAPGTKRRKRLRLLGPKKGLAVHFGHENWNMVLSMMIGIRMSVGRIKHEMSRELTPVDFIMKEKFSIIPRMANIFDSEISKRVTMTRFIDYAPMVFQRIRSSFGIHHDDYLRSVGPEQLLGNMVLGNLSSLSELSSEGKSGAFFYYTADGKYMMKTVTQREFQLLKRMLKKYYDHIMKNSGTLIVRFLGLHCLQVKRSHNGPLHKDKKLHFVVMSNMFNTPFQIHRRYDLKGSWVARVTPGKHSLDPTIALKDVDFKQANEAIRVGPELKEKLIKQIESDSGFLRDNNVIDYSILLGIHDIGKERNDDEDDAEEGKASVQISEGQIVRTNTGATQMTFPASPASGIPGTPPPQVAGTREVPCHQRDLGGLLSADQRQLYFFGIIDILTPYDTRKKMEHHLKALRHDRRGVSCCPPVFYSERFNDFMRTAFE